MALDRISSANSSPLWMSCKANIAQKRPIKLLMIKRRRRKVQSTKVLDLSGSADEIDSTLGAEIVVLFY